MKKVKYIIKPVNCLSWPYEVYKKSWLGWNYVGKYATIEEAASRIKHITTPSLRFDDNGKEVL